MTLSLPVAALARLARPGAEIGAGGDAWIGELCELELADGTLVPVAPVAIGIVNGRLETAPDREALESGRVYRPHPDDERIALAALRYLRDPDEPPERPAGSPYWRHETPRTVAALGRDRITSIQRAPGAHVCAQPGAYLCGG